MPHPEREHSLQIEVARLHREVEIATNGWVAEKARSDLYAAEARGLELTLATAESALAAARRECDRLRDVAEKAADTFRDLQTVFRVSGKVDCERACKIAEDYTRAALAAPADGEEGT